MTRKTQKQEMLDAAKEGRIPMCVSCNHEVHKICMRPVGMEFKYDEQSHKYVLRIRDPRAYDTGHSCHECHCEYQSNDFADYFTDANLGVTLQ